MKPERLFRAILPDVLIDNFDIVNFRQECWPFWYLSWWKKVQLKEDKTNPDIISYGFGEYRTIQDYPIRGRATYLMSVNVNGLTSLPMKSSVMTGIYPNLTVHSSILSSFSFKRRRLNLPLKSICVLARNVMENKLFVNNTKEKISDYRNWDQLEHAYDYLPLSWKTLEKTLWWNFCLSNGDVYTILTIKQPKAVKGFSCNGSWVATDAVSGILRRLPNWKRLWSVKTVTG